MTMISDRQWQSDYIVQLANSYHPQNASEQDGSKKYKESTHIHGKPPKFISLPNVMHEYLKLDLDF